MLHVSTKTLTLAGTLPGMEACARKPDRIKEDLLHRRRAARRLLVDARRERNAIELILTLPSPTESLHFVIDGRFEPCDLIPAIRRLSDPAIITRLEITTLGLNTDNIATLARGMDQGKIGTVTLVCSIYFAGVDGPIFETAKKEIEGRGGKVYGLRTHSKIMLFEMSDGRCFTVEGSGNMRSCKSIEQFCLTNDRELLLFHRKWLNDYIDSQVPSNP